MHQLLNEAKEMQDMIVADRRYLHSHPETEFALGQTLKYVENKLTDMGYKVQHCGKAGLVVVVGGHREGKVFLLRADMDALPIREQTQLEFASDNGCMHACGHDMHTAMLLGAARLLKRHEHEIEGTVKLMFQPAEEVFEGARDMIESGVLENPNVDAALMIHVMAGMPFEAGSVVVANPGVSAPAADYFEIRVQGKGCHGSMPNTGVDPLNAAAHILIALQEIQARELAMNDSVALTIGTMNAGTAPNIIPDTALMGGTLRTFDEETRGFIKQRMQEITQGIAHTFRAEAEIVYGSQCPTLINDADLCDQVEKYLRDLLGGEKVFTVKSMTAAAGGKKVSKTAGSEDFAYVSHEVPAVMLSLAAGQAEKGHRYPQHHPMVTFDEGALYRGSAVHAYVAMKWLQEHKY